MKQRSKLKLFWYLVLAIFTIGLLLPQSFQMPVLNATKRSYNQQSFWYYPWGKSVTHKGVDIFAKAGTPIRPSTNGFVIYTGQISLGGNVVLVLGPKWRLHYYAHLQEITTSSFSWVNKIDTIGLVGATGNAKGKPPHLHYSIFTLVSYPWRIDKVKQGWKKIFYLNPIEYLNQRI